MKFPVLVEPAAEADFLASFEWYEGQIEGLGHEFLAAARICFVRLEKLPEMYPKVLGICPGAGI